MIRYAVHLARRTIDLYNFLITELIFSLAHTIRELELRSAKSSSLYASYSKLAALRHPHGAVFSLRQGGRVYAIRQPVTTLL